MLGLQGSASFSKEYECVACSATFTGLAALLVHQATHAGSLPTNVQKPPDTDPVEAPCTVNNEEREALLPKMEHLTSIMYKCDCGEEFSALSDMTDHKQCHTSEVQSSPSVDHALTKEEDSSDYKWDVTSQTDAVLGKELKAEPFDVDLTSMDNSTADVNQEENNAVASTESQSLISAPTDDDDDDDEEHCDTKEMPEETEGKDIDETSTINESPMKDFASVHGKHQLPSDEDNIAMTLKEEPELVAITPQTKPPQTTPPSTDTDVPTMQLKRLLGKTGMKTKASSISKLLEASSKTIVSLTKIFSPVVILETRQKLKDINSNKYGKYQCSRCRRVFQDADTLTEHHVMHKKERIKCCRCCKQLIIGRIPLPDNHVCPWSRGKATVASVYSKGNVTDTQKSVQINHKRVFFCPVCKNNFPQRSSLKMHKCAGLFSDQLQRRSMKQQHDNAGLSGSFLKVQDSQWTAPLNNETEMPLMKNDSYVHPSAVLRDGRRRYSCEKCHKTFGLSSNLYRHKKVCLIKPKDSVSRYNSKNVPLNANVPVFSCYVCGRNFNRKDNMLTHRKKCEQRRTMIPNLDSEIENCLLSSDETQDQPQEEDEGDWRVMSLPSVLPRRVTCECGLGFTSPQLLLEHLQKHAQESYTCPTCGVTVKSWAEYQTHLQLHMHPLHHKKTYPLLLQFKRDTSVEAPSEQAPQSHKGLKYQARKRPYECPKCGNAFARRCALKRHMTWAQCSGNRANAINYI